MTFYGLFSLALFCYVALLNTDNAESRALYRGEVESRKFRGSERRVGKAVGSTSADAALFKANVKGTEGLPAVNFSAGFGNFYNPAPLGDFIFPQQPNLFKSSFSPAFLPPSYPLFNDLSYFGDSYLGASPFAAPAPAPLPVFLNTGGFSDGFGNYPIFAMALPVSPKIADLFKQQGPLVPQPPSNFNFTDQFGNPCNYKMTNETGKSYFLIMCETKSFEDYVNVEKKFKEQLAGNTNVNFFTDELKPTTESAVEKTDSLESKPESDAGSSDQPESTPEPLNDGKTDSESKSDSLDSSSSSDSDKADSSSISDNSLIRRRRKKKSSNTLEQYTDRLIRSLLQPFEDALKATYNPRRHA